MNINFLNICENDLLKGVFHEIYSSPFCDFNTVLV
jgi:hypothetical protein